MNDVFTQRSLFHSCNLHKKMFPTRNSDRSTYSRPVVPPCWKARVGLELTHIALSSSILALLAGDINLNPGPPRDPCCVCLKGCRKNQKAIQCDECQGWFHAKCISMPSSEYNLHALSNDSNWSCNSCLFPQADVFECQT